MTANNHPWWLGMPPVEAEAGCQAAPHRLRWEQGDLTPIDHADPEGERLLVALGAEPVGCLEITTNWDQHSRDARLLAIGPRERTDRLALTGGDLAEVGRHLSNIAASHRSRWPVQAAERLVAVDPRRVSAANQQRRPFAFRSLGLAASVMASGEAGWRNHVGLLELCTMPRHLLDRLQLQIWASRAQDLRGAALVLAAATDDLENAAGDAPAHYSRDRPALLAAAIARVRAAVIAWFAPPSQGPDPEVAVRLSADDAPLRLIDEGFSSAGRRMVAAEVGCDWVPSVFGRQMGVVDGHLVLELIDLTEMTARVRALPPDGLGAAPVLIDIARYPSIDSWGVGAAAG
jgi:hypothetical protein